MSQQSWSEESLCPIVGYGDGLKVRSVNDGDTFTLTNGVRVRVLGIDAPEMNYKKPENSQPGAVGAMNYLKQLIKPGDEVFLFFDKKTQDRYGRILANVRLKNKQNLSALMLQQGWAQQLVYPPNIKYWDCYKDLEKEARAAKKGIWTSSRYIAKSTVSANKLTSGYRRYYGKVTQREISSRYLWFLLDDKIWLGFKKNDLIYFPKHYFDDFIGKSIEISGWTYYSHDALRIRVSHPQQIDFIEDLSAHPTTP